MRLGASLLTGLLFPCAAVTSAILASGIAAAAPPVTAPTAPTVPMAPRAPSASAPTETPVATQPTLKVCNRQADARSLTGKERATFVRECQAGRTPSEQ